MEGGGAIEPERTRFLFASPPTGTVTGGLGAERCLARRSHGSGGFEQRGRASNRREVRRAEGICMCVTLVRGSLKVTEAFGVFG